MASRAVKMSAFLALAQHEVQQTLEYLAHPQVRGVTQGSPSQVLATVGNVKMTVPLHFAIVQTPELPQRQPGAPAGPEEVLLPGIAWPPGSQHLFQIDVMTPRGHLEHSASLPGLGTVQIDFVTVLKQ